MNNIQLHPKVPLAQSLVWVGLAVCLFYWFLESWIHVVIFKEGSLISSIFTPDPHELWKRFLVLSLMIVFSIYAQRSINIRRKTEEALALALGEMDQIFQTASVGMRVIDRNYNVLKINKTYEKITRVSAAEAVGRKCHMIFAGPMCFTPECPLTLILKGQENVECHVNKKRPDGSIVPCILTATPFIGSDGNFIGIVESFKDITELERAKEEIRTKRDKLQSILSHMKEGVSIVNFEYTIEFQNSTHKKFIGEQEGILCYRAFKNLDAPCDPCLMHEAIRTGNTRLIEFDTSAGESFEQAYTPIIDIDGRQKALVLLRDVTREKNAIAAMMQTQQLAAVGELAAGVAHEINNPINGLINYAQILINKYSDHNFIKEISSRMVKEGNRIARIVEGLLFFSRARKEEKSLTPINEVLYDSLTLTASQLRKDNIHLITDIPENLPMVLAQAHEIEQVFINLISNARYALNQKYPEANDDKVLEIKARTVSKSKLPQGVEISFRDYGTGIPANLLDKVRNPFFTTKKGRQSTGLGLSISHGIINEHGGVLRIDSIENLYTDIIVNLPIHEIRDSGGIHDG